MYQEERDVLGDWKNQTIVISEKFGTLLYERAARKRSLSPTR